MQFYRIDKLYRNSVNMSPMKIFYLLLSFLLCAHFLEGTLNKKVYSFSSEPIDVVIPCAPKDRATLDLCIRGIRKYGENIRRIIVVSKEQLTNEAEWFNETNYPFTKEDLAYEIFRGQKAKIKKFLSSKHPRIGWILQQFLKLYAPFVIPGISSNVLIVDADVIFLKPTSFMNEKGEPFFNVGDEYHIPYFEHMQRVLPDLVKVQKEYSGITHHMLFQKPVLEDLFSLISERHRLVAWKALCRAIDPKQAKHSSLSEYEIYFNFAQLRSDQVVLRPLRFKNIFPLDDIKQYKTKNYNYITSHNYL
jgi:hypothetical protein